jgi:uncharacterized protein YecT (DUF1311 family)
MTRRSLAVWAILFGFLSALTEPGIAAIPGQPAPADVKTIEDCLASVEKDKTDPDACIGKVTAMCQQTASGPAAAAAQVCISRELLVWNSASNRDFARLNALLTDSDAKEALREVQRSFVLFKLKECTFVRIARKDPVDALAAGSRCNLKATARYEIWLLDQVDALK